MGTHTTHKIEMIQRSAARWVFSNYDYHNSILNMLAHLNWPTLEGRWRESRLSLLSRIINHQEPAIKIPPYSLPQTSATRHSHNLHSILYPHLTPKVIKKVIISYRTIKEWNKLPTSYYEELQHL